MMNRVELNHHTRGSIPKYYPVAEKLIFGGEEYDIKIILTAVKALRLKLPI